MNLYKVGPKLLGSGGFAHIIEVIDKDKTAYALKKPFHSIRHLERLDGIINMKELYIMAHIKHPYIQSAKIVFFSDPCPVDNAPVLIDQGYDRMFFLMDKANYSCHELAHTHRNMAYIKRAMFQIACAVYYLHSKDICHRDLKPGNFLCYIDKETKGLTTKLTDFGMTKPMNKVNLNSTHTGTSYYRPPEILLKNEKYTLNSDIWSLGCAFFEMASRQFLFKGDNEIDVIDQIFKIRGSPSAEVYSKISSTNVNVVVGPYKGTPIRTHLLKSMSKNDQLLFNYSHYQSMENIGGTIDELADLLDMMLQLDPSKRAKSYQVLAHPFFKQFFTTSPMLQPFWKPPCYKRILAGKYPRREKDYINEFPSAHEHWKIGAYCFTEMECNSVNYSPETKFSVLFHALDLYNRFLLKTEPHSDKDFYKRIAWVCGYILSKFYLDEASDNIWDLFPDSENVLNNSEITNIERFILQAVDYEIYNPTCFTYLEHNVFYETLFALMLQDSKIMYGKSVKNTMKYFNSHVKELISNSKYQTINLC